MTNELELKMGIINIQYGYDKYEKLYLKAQAVSKNLQCTILKFNYLQEENIQENNIYLVKGSLSKNPKFATTTLLATSITPIENADASDVAYKVYSDQEIRDAILYIDTIILKLTEPYKTLIQSIYSDIGFYDSGNLNTTNRIKCLKTLPIYLLSSEPDTYSGIGSILIHTQVLLNFLEKRIEVYKEYIDYSLIISAGLLYHLSKCLYYEFKGFSVVVKEDGRYLNPYEMMTCYLETYKTTDNLTCVRQLQQILKASNRKYTQSKDEIIEINILQEANLDSFRFYKLKHSNRS